MAGVPCQALGVDHLRQPSCVSSLPVAGGPDLPFLSHSLKALLVYRVFRNETKRTTKVLHGLLHVFAFIIALVGEFLGTAFPFPHLCF